MKTEQQGGVDFQRRHHHHHHQHHSSTRRSTRKFKPNLVVVQSTKSTIPRSAKSTGDLRALDENDHYNNNEDDVFGETDAQLYYNQKAQGELGRRNGRKQRPDEAKRLEMIMAKKSMQRERMACTAASGKR
jgi:hypothetical protein